MKNDKFRSWKSFRIFIFFRNAILFLSLNFFSFVCFIQIESDEKHKKNQLKKSNYDNFSSEALYVQYIIILEKHYSQMVHNGKSRIPQNIVIDLHVE